MSHVMGRSIPPRGPALGAGLDLYGRNVDEQQERRRNLLGHDDDHVLLVGRGAHLQVRVNLRDVAGGRVLRRAGVEHVGGARFGAEWPTWT